MIKANFTIVFGKVGKLTKRNDLILASTYKQNQSLFGTEIAM